MRRASLALLRRAAAAASPASACGGAWAGAAAPAAAGAEPPLSLARRLSLGLGLGLGLAASTAAAASCAPATDALAAAAGSAAAAGGVDLSRAGVASPDPARTVVFVLGGPGSGKGTQCTRLAADFPAIVHLSAGDLLRAHTKSGTADGDAVAAMIAAGQIVPSSVTVGLLEAAMQAATAAAGGATRLTFLIDGFPRNDENRAAYEAHSACPPSLVLFFECPEDVMTARLLGRNQGRSDDNEATIRKRFAVFHDSTLPVVSYYEAKGAVARVNADRAPDAVYEDVRALFEGAGAVAVRA